ncbi:MAG: hypothetical protein JXR65_10350, partial [Bacteroidales bacterium]|nr:hypothetical protein [Bacteroidales bacterium]
SNQSLSVTPDYQLEVEKDGTINGYGDEFSVWLGVPLKPDKKSKPIGVIAIQDYKNLEPYSEIDQALMEIISYHIVGFIERIKYLQELVRAKEKAEESEAQMNESQRVARIGYYSFNIKEGTWKSSDMLDEIFGIDDNYNRDVNGWLNLIHPDFKEIMQDYLHKEVITGRNRFDKQYKIINQKTQSEQWVHGLGNLGFNNQGEAITMFGTIQDISNIKQYEDELIHAKERAEESDKLKSAFLANMSHEIRTPMNGILGFLELLQDLNLSKEERDTYFDIVNKSGKRLMDTVNDIIEMSIIESGQIQITPKQVQVANLLSDFSDFFSLQAKEKGVKLILKIPKKSQKLVITTDESKLGIIISNLLRNAIKFTDKGQIDFGIKEEDDIVFYVKDTGRGIPQESLESIFDRFVQADNSLTRNYEGSGLGLSICQGYVKLLGGKIWVESTINKGSSFYFTLPYSFAFYNKNLIQSSSLKI